MYRTFTVIALTVLVSLPVAAQDVEVGYASWYNRGFNGLSTASGEAYNHEGLTAAHPSLPFGTVVQVVRTDDGRSIAVRINDRMQSGPGHVIDLSGAAARELGLLETGVARVRLVPGKGQEAAGYASRPSSGYTNTAANATVQGTGRYTLQLGVFSTRLAAEGLQAKHEGAWIHPTTDFSGTTMYRVNFRRYEAEAEARSAQEFLWGNGVDSFLRTLN